MAKCGICGKGVAFGIKLSHSHRRTNRTFKPNVQKVRAIVDGTPCRVHACTRCLRSGKVQRNVRDIKINDVQIAETIDVAVAMDAVAEAQAEA